MKEIWKGWMDGYEASNHGRIRSYHKTGKGKLYDNPHILKGYLLSGYRAIKTNRKAYLIHRIILETFIGPCPKGLEASHLDGNRQNNHVDNLIWETRRKNARRRIEHGTQIKGSQHHGSKLTESDIIQIRILLENKMSQKKVGELFGVTKGTIRMIHLKRTWRHV